jgi:pimeloyl-ACP methyl ester carboxylesterase
MPDSSSRLTASGSWRTAAWTAAAGLGAYAGLAAARSLIRSRLAAPSTLPKALNADTGFVDLPGGGVNYYHRPGTGTPVVFVHSFNAAASSFEFQPLFEHLARRTDRPLYAMDWLGFGRSDRPDVDYVPDLYTSHLFAFLRDVVETPCDLVGLSLGCEYAARITLQGAPMVRRLVLINPTGLSERRGPSTGGKLGIALAAGSGAFELLYYRLTREASLRDFYERQIFLTPDAVPDALVEYAYVTTHAKGAHRAPRRFVDGTLFTGDVAQTVYSRLYRPTLLLTPADPAPTVQRFDRLPEVLDAASRDLTHRPLPGGLLPHWDAPDACFDALDAFLEE